MGAVASASQYQIDCHGFRREIHTDGYAYVDENGVESVRVSRIDSLLMGKLKALGIKLVVISKEENHVVLARCEKLKIECFQGVENASGKLAILQMLMRRDGFSREETLFVGDDINDLNAVEWAGVGVTVADGERSVRAVANLVLTRGRGDHVLRELFELILDARARYPKS